MVHALNEIQRVLVPGGSLIDLRPVLNEWPVEIASSQEYHEVGRATDLPEPLADDEAANRAMSANAEHGRFLRESEGIFSLYYYWDTPKEMQEYITENWGDVIRLEEELWNKLASSWATADADARIRMRMKMLITRWKKPNAAGTS